VYDSTTACDAQTSIGEARPQRESVLDREAQRQQLNQKLAELRVLEREIDGLRDNLGLTHQIALECCIVEISHTALQTLDVEIESPNGSRKVHEMLNSLGTAAATEDAALVKLLLEFSRKKQVARVIASPTLTTLPGRPARFQSGAEYSVQNPDPLGNPTMVDRKVGTHIEVHPMFVRSDKVPLESGKESQMEEIRTLFLITPNGHVAGTGLPRPR
jgi:Flp pilus assembly secretin CpaC